MAITPKIDLRTKNWILSASIAEVIKSTLHTMSTEDLSKYLSSQSGSIKMIQTVLDKFCATKVCMK